MTRSFFFGRDRNFRLYSLTNDRPGSIFPLRFNDFGLEITGRTRRILRFEGESGEFFCFLAVDDVC